METIYIGLITLFIYGVYDISGLKQILTDYYLKKEWKFFHKLFNCLFCLTFWISFGITIVYDKSSLLIPIYFSGFMYLLIKLRWK